MAKKTLGSGRIPDAEAQTPRGDMIVRSLGEAILSIALDGTIESCNPAAERLYGYTAAEMVGASMEMLRPEASTTVPPDWEALSKGGWVSLDTSAQRKDDTIVDVSVTMSPLRDASGTVTGVVSTAVGCECIQAWRGAIG